MTDTPQVLTNRLREEGVRVIEFFNHLTQDQWGGYVYPKDSCGTLHHLLAHFVSSEIGRKELIINVSAGGQGATPNFKIDTFNQEEVGRLLSESNSYLLELFSQERADLIAFVSALDMEDLERIGNDPFLGKVPLSEMIKLTYRHLQIHLRDARRCL